MRGFRIELTEVEVGLARHPDLRGAAVTVRGEQADSQRLVAYVVPGHRAVTAAELAAFLATFLPWYMIPVEFFAVPSLPLTPNGKLDREALISSAGTIPLAPEEYDEPQSEAERQIAAVWQEALQRDAIGRNDSFFLLGGHSLLALQVCVRLERLLGRPVPATTLFEYPYRRGPRAVVRIPPFQRDRGRRTGEHPESQNRRTQTRSRAAAQILVPPAQR